MNRLLVLLCLALMLLPMSGVHDAHAKSWKNEAACNEWCSSNKPRCKFCDSNTFCGGKDHDVIHSFKKGSGNWYACGESRHLIESRNNEGECWEWCKANSAICARCTSGACGREQKVAKRWTGRGENWRACEKNRARAEAEAWCADYTRTLGARATECRVVKSGQSCPGNLYKAEYMRTTWARNYKVCLERKIDSQRVKDCSGAATAHIEKALDWINSNYDAILEGYRLQPRDFRDRRAHRRMERKFSVASVTCEDHRKKCKKSDAPLGWSAGGRKIHLCYKKQDYFCGLVKTIIHEAGHNAWADMEWDQHHGTPQRRDDTVHVLGFRAQDLCKCRNSGRTNIAIPAGCRSSEYRLNP